MGCEWDVLRFRGQRRRRPGHRHAADGRTFRRIENELDTKDFTVPQRVDELQGVVAHSQTTEPECERWRRPACLEINSKTSMRCDTRMPVWNFKQCSMARRCSMRCWRSTSPSRSAVDHLGSALSVARTTGSCSQTCRTSRSGTALDRGQCRAALAARGRVCPAPPPCPACPARPPFGSPGPATPT